MCVYVYESRGSTHWSQTQTLFAGTTPTVAAVVNNNIIVAGKYIYSTTKSTWILSQVLTPTSWCAARTSAKFGSSVAIQDGLLMIGSGEY